jgi:hypothetical protein
MGQPPQLNNNNNNGMDMEMGMDLNLVQAEALEEEMALQAQPLQNLPDLNQEQMKLQNQNVDPESNAIVTEPPQKWRVCLPRSYRGILDEARIRKHTHISIQYKYEIQVKAISY